MELMATLKVEHGYEDMRIDVFIAKKMNSYSRSLIQNLIRQGNIRVDGKKIKPSYRLSIGEKVKVCIPKLSKTIPEPENIDIDIIYEDEDIAVINKLQGMVVHPAPGHDSGTLVNALLYHFEKLSDTNGKFRPGIVHRIDKDTSGAIIIAKNNEAHINLARQIADRSAQRIYWALVENNISEELGTINAPIKRHPIDRKKMAVLWEPKNREAVTHYKVLERYNRYTLVEASLETGRTHQIRVHMAYIKHPIVGDPLYGTRRQKFNLKGQMLHAISLGLKHPVTGKFMEFRVPIPKYFEKLLCNLRGLD